MTPGPRHSIGIDVGGTKIAGGLVDTATGQVLARRQAMTGAARGGDAVLDEVAAMAADLRDWAAGQGIHPRGLGIGVAELVTPDGTVFSGHRIRWAGVDLGQRLAAHGPVRVEADVRAAARAEARFGAGRGADDFYYVTIGTGVSGVAVIGGRPYAGSRGAALVIANGRQHRPCSVCGHVGTQILEDIAGGPGLAAATGLPDAESVLARAADPAVGRVIDHAADLLGDTIALLVGALDPAMVVIGGGLGSAPGRYWDRLQGAIRAGLWDGDSHPLPIRQAALGPDAGLIGAAMILTEQEPEHGQTHETA